MFRSSRLHRPFALGILALTALLGGCVAYPAGPGYGGYYSGGPYYGGGVVAYGGDGGWRGRHHPWHGDRWRD